MLILAVLYSSAHVFRLVCSLAIMYLNLGWKVRKARRALEKELIRSGMSKQDARRIGARYAALKDDAVSAVKKSITGFWFAFQ